jgi:multidrug efflux system outer membrane protein
LNLLVAQQSYYSVQQILVQTKLTAAQNKVDVYQALGGDALLQAAPLCNVRYAGNAGNATLMSQCPPL